MLLKNLTTFPAGTKVCSRRPPRPEACLVVKGTFALAPGDLAVAEDQETLRAEVFDDADAERAGECLYPGDFADLKLNAEVMLVGSCYAPRGQPVTECGVRFAVGSWSKTLSVVGPRVWTDAVVGRPGSDPLSFTEMPLSFANAFGGPGHAPNPVGKGLHGSEMPTVELARDPLRSRSQRPEPASFGPINPGWPARAQKTGKEYGKSWRAERAPFQSVDFDWTFFHAAPRDQQLEGYLKGDEEIALTNLVADAPLLRTKLPGLRIRAFFQDDEGRFRAVAMSLDTLVVDTTKKLVMLTWRGADPVREKDLADLSFGLVASEKLSDKPLPEAHYQKLLEEFAADPSGVKAKTPAVMADIADRKAKIAAGEPVPADASPLVLRLMEESVAIAAPGKSMRFAEELKKGAVPPASLARITRALDADEPPIPVIKKPGAMPNVGLKRRMRAVLASVEKQKDAAAGKDLPAEARAQLDAAAAVPFNPELTKLDPTYEPPVHPISTDALGPGADLCERDLSGKDLSGIDLTGAKLRDAILTGAKLRGAKLRGADFTNALLYKTDFTEADLGGANLTRVNAARARFVAADLREAVVEMAYFESASFVDARLGKATGEYAAFPKANLEGADLVGIQLVSADFTEAVLEQSSFKDATLSGTTFERARAREADFSRAFVGGARFVAADLRGAKLPQIRGDVAVFLDAVLEGADLSAAVLPNAHFTGARAARCRFTAAVLRKTRFYRAQLDGAQFARADLLGADLCKTSLSGTMFTGANLYDTKFLDAAGSGTDFKDANLTRSTLERS